MNPLMPLHNGRCHCGAVEIEIQAPTDIEALECNCSMCERTGFLHLIVPKGDFHLLRGAELMTTYTFNTQVAQHYFCSVCGCKPFYVPRSNPDGYSVNVRCLDKSTFENIIVRPFDGQNWEENAAHLAHLSHPAGD